MWMWAASWGPVDTRWHVVTRRGGGALPSACGAWVYGPVFTRRAVCPDGVADREICPVCALWVGVAVPRPMGLFTWGESVVDSSVADVAGIVASGVLPEPWRAGEAFEDGDVVVWPTVDPDAPAPAPISVNSVEVPAWKRGRGRHRLRERPGCRGTRQAAA